MDAAANDALKARIEAEHPSLIEIRHDLHAHPQTAFQETYANGVVVRELERIGIEYTTGLAETGVVAWIVPGDRSAAKRSAIGLRADMDALPIEEETSLAYASQNQGTMHACGHDGHTTILLGAARILAAMRQDLPRPVKCVFQPAEEIGGGAKRMIDDGALGDRAGGPAVGHMFGLHGWPHATLGTFQTRPGTLFASTDWIDIVVQGHSGHAAAPHRAADPILATAQTISALQSIVSRNVDPATAAVLSITALQAGSAYNIIPESVAMKGTIRVVCRETRDRIHERVVAIAQQTAAAMGCEADVQIDTGYPTTTNDAAFTDRVVDCVRRVLGGGNVSIMEHPAMVAEDFAYYGAHVPSCFALLGLRPTHRKNYPGLHTPQFDFNDAAIPLGVQLMCSVALDEAACQ